MKRLCIWVLFLLSGLFTLQAQESGSHSPRILGFNCFGSGGVSSLDVRGCTALTSLNCGGNQLSSLDVRGFTALTSLSCGDNQLSSLDVRGCTALTSLSCGGNQLSSLDVRGCTALTSLYCGYNSLSSLDVSGCTALTSLSCYNNQLSSLDVSGCTALTSLYCSYNNQLSSLDVRGCTALTSLDCRYNRLSSLDVSRLALKSLDVSGCTALTSLSCYGNELSSLDVSGFTALRNLSCYGNRLTSLDVRGCTALTSLSCYSNGLSSLDMRGCTALTSLDCRYNHLSSLDVSGCTALTSLSCYGNELSSLDVSGCTALKELGGVTAETLRIYGESMDTLAIKASGGIDSKIGVLNAAGCTTLRQIKFQNVGRINLQGCTALMSLDCHNGKVSSINVRGCTSLQTLNCYNNPLNTLDVSGCTALQTLDCHSNDLNSLDVSGCTALTSLDCCKENIAVRGQLSSLNVRGCTALMSLDCSNNKLSSLDVSGCTALTSLECWRNQLSSLDVSGCMALTSLSCYNNQLSSLDVSANTALTSLDCGGNQLSSLDVSGCTALMSLDCSNNKLSSLDVSANTALMSLNCGGNQLSSLDVSGCTALTSLSCYNNQLSSLDVSGYTALRSLSCYNNQLSSLDVSGCTALTSLSCYDNQLSSLDVSGYTALTSLTCHNNQLRSLDVSGCTALSNLRCTNNRIPLSMLYKARCQRSKWESFDAGSQSDSIIVLLDESWDLTTERKIGNNTTYSLKDAYGNFVSDGFWTENKFVFQFHEPGNYQLKLTNRWFSEYYSFTWHVSVMPCYAVQLAANNPEWGTVTGNGIYERGTEITITATANNGCFFNGWKKDGKLFSDKAVHTFTVTENLELTADFEAGCTVHVASNNPEWGTVTGSGIYKKGTEITISARPKEGYRFVNWTKKDGTEWRYWDESFDFSVMEDLELTANFQEVPRYTVRVVSSNPEWGTATIRGWDATTITCEDIEIVIIEATPNEGYRFVNWTREDGTELSTESVFELCVRRSWELTANFEKLSPTETFTVSLSSNNPNWGIVSLIGNGTCERGEVITIIATPMTGFRFVNWTKQDGSVFTTEAVHAFAVIKNLELTANFEKIPEEVESFTVVLAANNNAYGSVSQTGSGTYEEDSQVTITATPNNGYRFVNWMGKNGSVFSTEAVHTFTITENVELTANFEKISEEVESFTVVLAANNNAYGSVSQTGNGPYEEGSQVTITATSNAGYRFVDWTRKDGTVFATEAVHTFTVTENMELTANFEKIPEEVENFMVVLASNNNAYGSISQTGNGTYEEGSQVTITATPNNGYRFVNWTRKNGSVFSTEAVHTFAVMENIELTANFEKIPEEVENFTVVLAANNNTHGSVSQTGTGTYEEGSQVTITATPNNGYRFVNWTRKNGSVFSTEAVHTFAVMENIELTANFEKIPEELENFTVVLASNNNAYGSVSQRGNGTYEDGSRVTITATPKEGYRFVNWTGKNGSVFATEAVHTFTVTENVELTANFEKKPDVANESREDNGFYVYVQDHTIHLSAGRGVARVYNAAGVCVYSGQSTAIPVQSSGLYIVRIGERAYKAMVR